MPEVGSTWVTVLPDMRRFNTDIARGATSAGTASGKSFGAKFVSSAAVGLAAFGAIRVFGNLISEAQEAAKITRLTENAIRATGGVANVTADQVGNLANAISNATAVDDELIQSGANLILTFKNVRNEIGANNNIFDRATEAAVDLAAAGFGSVESASVMLGKALNDPIAGLTALGRAGVTFTEQQKEQIRVLTESGDVLSAQRIILDEVASQVGGAAAAAADPIERLRVVAGNLGEDIGTLLLPYVESFATFISDTAVPAIYTFIQAFKDGETPLSGTIGFVQDLGAFLGTMVGFIKDNINWLAPLTAAIWLLNIALAANPIVLIITLLGGLVAAFIYAWQNSETFRGIILGVFAAVGAGMDALGRIAATVWYSISRTFVDGVNYVVDVINLFLDGLTQIAALASPIAAQGLATLGLSHMGYPNAPNYGNVALPDIPRAGGFHEGGVIPGTGSGDIVSMFGEPGEIVIRKSIAQRFKDFLLALNSGQAEAMQAAGGGRPQRFATGGTVAQAQDWARQNSGRPYIWGGVGPNGWDCSGWMSDIANFLLGTTMHKRRFATASMAGGVNAGGFLRGDGSAFTIGVDPGSHTAGTLGGINVESGSGHGGIIGGKALGAKSGFQYGYYLPGILHLAAMASALAGKSKLAGADGIVGMLRSLTNGVTGESPSWVQGLETGVYDNGGILRSGTAAINTSGRDEIILNPDQTAAALNGKTFRIAGTLDMGNGLYGYVEGVISDTDDQKKLDRRSLQVLAK